MGDMDWFTVVDGYLYSLTTSVAPVLAEACTGGTVAQAVAGCVRAERKLIHRARKDDADHCQVIAISGQAASRKPAVAGPAPSQTDE